MRRLLVCAWLWLAVAAAAAAPPPPTAVVTRIVDGDTVHVETDGRDVTVRLIGVDTPELHSRDDPRAAPQPFARQASDFTRLRLADRTVRLEFESDERLDRYGRTLAYVFLPDGTFFNRELVRGGYARAYVRFPFRFREQFVADETAARQAGRGLWAEANARVVNGLVIGNRRSRLYHLPGQKHYDDVSVRNRVYFANEDAARAAGYTPARQ
ncbi:MAG: thermonuclease family protein [bacterium]